MHLSLKSSLGRQILTGIYVKDNRVLDLTTPFSELTFTLEDKSGEGNDATLYSGRYISTDGSTDRGIVADCSAAGAGNYYLTGKVRPNAVTTAELTMDGSTDSGLTGLTADVWQTFTTATSAVTPSAVQVGYDGSTASAADWSDVKLIDASDGSTVARWQLNESADGDLNGYPALDSSGNGYHGTHTGCAGGTGEAGILQTAGMDWNRGYPLSNDLTVDWVEAGAGSIIDSNTFTTTTAAAGVYHPITLGRTYRYEISGTTTGSFQIWDWGTGGSILAAKTGSGSFSFSGTFTTAGSSRQFYIRASNGAIQIDLTSIVLVWDNYLIPASDATPTNDALGNAIAEPRPTIDTWNLFGDGEYGLVADADSLDLTTEATWEIWGNFYGVQPSNMGIFSKWDFGSDQRSWRIGKQSTTLADGLHLFLSTNGTDPVGTNIPAILADTTQHLVITYDAGTLLTYIDGALVATDTSTETSIFSSTAVIQIGANGIDPPTEFYDDKISRPKIYNRAFTADEVLQNYNAQKGAFGL